MKPLFTAVRALFFMSGFVFLWAWVALAVRKEYDPVLGITLPRWLEPAGAALFVLGGALALTCVASFVVVGKGTPAPFDAPRVFVAVGPYRYVRNPMYIGAFFVVLGFGLYLNSAAILLFGLPWLFFAHVFVLVYEEPALRRRFGGTYETYCARVHRWIPRRPP
jgi:protein-S-isoprenylcysteine O-methyltransferase Ste14